MANTVNHAFSKRVILYPRGQNWFLGEGNSLDITVFYGLVKDPIVHEQIQSLSVVLNFHQGMVREEMSEKSTYTV